MTDKPFSSFSNCDNTAHGEDAYRVDEATCSGMTFVAVADGVSDTSDAARAATWSVECALECFQANPLKPMRLYRHYIEERLRREREERKCEMGGSTTLSVVRFHVGSNGRAQAEYLAIGDSPIILAYRGDLAEGLTDTFLSQQIHGKPMQYENPGRVYAWIDLGECKMVGRAAVGSFELEAGDVCLVATDGIPVRRHILNDLDEQRECHRFFNAIFSRGVEIAGRELFDRIVAADGFVDDGTLVAVVVGSGVSTHGGVQDESGYEKGLARKRIINRRWKRGKRDRLRGTR